MASSLYAEELSIMSIRPSETRKYMKARGALEGCVEGVAAELA